MTESSSIVSEVALLREASRLIRRLALPCAPGESVKASQRRVHRHLKTWTFNRVRDLWRPDPRARVRAHEIEALRMAAEKRLADRSAVAELRELQTRIARLERLLLATDPAFHSPSVAALGQQRSELMRAVGTRSRPDPAR